jgi:hypothetical protein
MQPVQAAAGLVDVLRETSKKQLGEQESARLCRRSSIRNWRRDFPRAQVRILSFGRLPNRASNLPSHAKTISRFVVPGFKAQRAGPFLKRTPRFKGDTLVWTKGFVTFLGL